jgi:hypothetical protein
MKYVLIILAIFELVQLRSLPSQSTRNYRKGHPDPSYNPLPNSWETGPRNSLPLQRPDKYHRYNSQLFNAHSYEDKTPTMRQKARARMILQ